MTALDLDGLEALAKRLADYRSRTEWGERVHHMICDEGAEAISSLISRVRSAEEERDAKNRDEFNRGYLIAVSTMMHQHGDDVIASDCLKELGVSEGILRKLGFDDFDAKPLRKLFRHLSEQARFRRARTALKGTSNDQG